MSLVDPHEAGGLPHAAAVAEVVEDGHGLLVRQSAAEEGGALALGEALLAGAAGEHAPLVPPVEEADAEVAPAAQAVVGAVRVLAAEEVKVFHEDHHATTLQHWTPPPGHCRKASGAWQP